MFPVPWSSRWSWSLHLFLGRPMFLRPFDLYCSACFGSLFVSILCTCCSHFFWYCFISFTMFCTPIFCLIHWLFSLYTVQIRTGMNSVLYGTQYRGADKSLARPRRKQANVSVIMAWISFGAFLCKKRKTWWELASRCCWNRARPWLASVLVSFLDGLRAYQDPGLCLEPLFHRRFEAKCMKIWRD